MGLSRKIFREMGGFNEMRYGEDIDLSIRLDGMGHQGSLIPDAFVYHKRRANLFQFFKQVFNSGVARIRLTMMHPGTLKMVHILPSLFTLGCSLLIVASLYQIEFLIPIVFFITVIFFHSSWINKNINVGVLSVAASFTQLLGYGLGFLYALFQSRLMKQYPHHL